MIFFLAIWPLIAASVFLWGFLALHLVDAVLGRGNAAGGDETRPGDVTLCGLWAGCAMLGGLFPLTALAFPLSPTVAGSLLSIPWLSLAVPSIRRDAIGLVGALVADRGSAWRFCALHGLALVPVAWLGSAQIVYFDTAFYHLPLARILGEYGAVVGLVGLFPNFGQTSSWFALAAPAVAGAEITWGSATASFFIAGLSAIHAATGLGRLARGSTNAADVIAGLGFPVVLFLAARWSMIASLSPDLPAMVLCIVVAWALALERHAVALATVMLSAALAITVKLSAVPIGLVAATFAVVVFRRQRALLVVCGILAVCAALPTIALGVLSSGCVAFPVALTCLPLPWTPEPAALARHADLILSAARGGGFSLPDTTPLGESLYLWMTRDVSGAVLVIGGLAAALVTFVETQIAGDSGRAGRRIPRWSLALGICGVLYVASTAPTGRFVGGYLAVLVALLIHGVPALWAVFSRPAVNRTVFVSMLIGLVALHQTGPGAARRAEIATQAAAGTIPNPGSGLLLPHHLFPFNFNTRGHLGISRWRMDTNGHVEVRVPIGGGDCWAAPPPCSPSVVPPRLRFRDPSAGIYGGYTVKHGV